MAATQEQVDALEAALAEGVRRVKYQDREVLYNSRSEMLAELARLKRELGQIPNPPYRQYAGHRRGIL